MYGSHSNRAGKYVRQSEGYEAFVPAPLPPNPSIEFTAELRDSLSRADRALGRLDGSIRTLPQPDLFISMYIRQEAVLSSRIEGTQSSLQDLLAAEAEIFASDYRGDVYEIINYIAAMNHGLQEIEHATVSTRMIREIHSKLIQNTRGSRLTLGEFRTDQNWIGPAGCRMHEAIFVPPPPSLVLEHMRELDWFMASEIDLPLLIKIGLVHAQFETIHPFLDGNGRVGRLIMTLLLCKSKVLEAPVLYLSWFFNRNRTEYYERLQSVRDEGKWEEWLIFFLQAVKEVSEHAATTARRILEMRESNRHVINEKFGRSAAVGHRILDRLYQFPFVRVNEVVELTGKTYASANSLVARMVDCGLLVEYTGWTRNRRYLLHNYVGLFNER